MYTRIAQRIQGGPKSVPQTCGHNSVKSYRFLIFTARCYASADRGTVGLLAMALCRSVRHKLKSVFYTNTAKRRITQTTSHDSPGTLVF